MRPTSASGSRISRDNDIWASDKWRELFGFRRPSTLDIDAILRRLHPDDREGFQQAHAIAIAGEDGGRYQTEYRLARPDGATRWISSQGRVEYDAAGQPVLIRGASREITARKRAELALHTLSGRLLSAQEDERRRIARELHDNLSQQMALLSIEIEQVAAQAGRSHNWRARYRSSVNGRPRFRASSTTCLIACTRRSWRPSVFAAAVRGHCREVLAQGVRVRVSAEGMCRRRCRTT